MWLVRFVERTSGRFLVINPRPAWTCTVFSFGLFELACLCSFFYGYGPSRNLRAWLGVRSFIAVLLSAIGWITSWTGMQAFLVAVEQEKVYLSASTANILFLGGGLVLVVVNIVRVLQVGS